MLTYFKHMFRSGKRFGPLAAAMLAVSGPFDFFRHSGAKVEPPKAAPLVVAGLLEKLQM